MYQITESHKPTMSSREIAELTGKRHGDVIRDIRTMIEQIGDDADLRHVVDVKDPRGYTAEFLLDRYHTEVLVTGYDVKRRAAVIKRWFDLETGAAKPAFQVPQSMAEALRLAADQAERIEQQQAAIEQARPSVEFVERYVDVGTTKTIRETAKILGLPEKAFIQAMIEDKILYRQSGNLLPHQKHHAAERFDVKTGERNGHAYTQTRVTSAGIGYLANFYGHWIGEVAA